MRITLVEGQYHQVKKMVGACGGYVQSLHRERIGAISLSAYPELREGSVMRAGPSEEALLRSMLELNGQRPASSSSLAPLFSPISAQYFEVAKGSLQEEEM